MGRNLNFSFILKYTIFLWEGLDISANTGNNTIKRWWRGLNFQMSNNSQCVPGTKFRLLYCNLFQILPFTIRLKTKRAYINLKNSMFWEILASKWMSKTDRSNRGSFAGGQISQNSIQCYITIDRTTSLRSMLATRKFHLYEVHQRIVMPDSLILSRISQSNFVYSRTGKVES